MEEFEQNKYNQEDPIAMYIVVREYALDMMNVGKTSAQVGHAVDMLCEKVTNHYTGSQRLSEAELNIFKAWRKESRRKITLRADEKEWKKLKEEFGSSMVLVVDAGFTQLPPGTETVIGLWPMHKSQRSKLIKRLQTLE